VFHKDMHKLQSVPKACCKFFGECCKHLFKNISSVSDYVANVFIWILHMFHTYYKSMFKIFQLFQSYVAISVFMLQVSSISIFFLVRSSRVLS